MKQNNKKSIILLLIMCLSVIFSCKSRRMHITENTVMIYDAFTGEKVKHTFRIKNKFNKKIILGMIHTGSPLNVNYTLNKKELNPGESTDFGVELDTIGLIGKQTFKILLYHTNAPNEQPMEFTFSAIFKNYIHSAPHVYLDFKQINASEAKTNLELELLPLKVSEKLKITKVEINNYDFITYQKLEYKNGEKILFTLDTKKTSDAVEYSIEKYKQISIDEISGKYQPDKRFFIKRDNTGISFEIPLTIYTDHPIQNFIRYIVKGSIPSDIIMRLPERGISFSDIIPNLSKGINHSKTSGFSIYSKNNKPFNITKISTTHGLISAEAKKVSSSEYQILVTFNKDKKNINKLDYNSGYVFIETDNQFANFFNIPYAIN